MLYRRFRYHENLVPLLLYYNTLSITSYFTLSSWYLPTIIISSFVHTDRHRQAAPAAMRETVAQVTRNATKQIQTAVAAYFKSKQLLLFALEVEQLQLCLRDGWGRCSSFSLTWSVASRVAAVRRAITGVKCAYAPQTRDVDPMLGYCWSSVVDGEPIIAQHWVNVSCLLGSIIDRQRKWAKHGDTEMTANHIAGMQRRVWWMWRVFHK